MAGLDLAPYAVGDRCEWRYIDPMYRANLIPEEHWSEVWIEAEVIEIRPDTRGWSVRVRTGFGFPSTWVRWIWCDYDGNGWDRFPHGDVRAEEVPSVCRKRMRPKA